ncbi:MAG TPA: polyketide synthase dehydratase domain-containing protein, partial [Rhodocyclaceae bacterium]|nr:polyketide synthase dehydratase domain-containing protein [Rhodocyclaceae bacterium]
GIDRVQELALRLHLLSGRDTLRGYFPAVGRFVDLPSYPWQRERHWLPATSEGYSLIERRRIHPLLGWPLKDAQASWENILDPRTQPWLADHCVGGAVVLPGAAYVEMALAAAREFFGDDTLELEELDIIAPVVFDGEHGRSIRLDLNSRDGGFQIRSRQRLSGDEWSLNASGRLLGAVSGYVEVIGQSLPESCEILDSDTHYRLAAALGLDYGPVFRGMAAARVAGDMLEGQFAAPVDLGIDNEPWLLHPAIVDVCFQSLINFFRSEIEAGVGLPLLPVKVGRLRLLHAAPITSFRTRILRRSLRSVLAEFELLAVDGEIVAILTGCRFRAAALRQDKQVDPACWKIQAKVQPGMQSSSISTLPATSLLAQQIKDWFIDQESELKRQAYFGETQPLFDALVTAFAHEAMQALIAAQPANAQGWLDNIGIAPHSLHWVRDLLVEQSYLVHGEQGWVLADSDMPPAAEIWRTLLADYPAAMPELVLIGRMGRALVPILLGELDPVVLAAEMRCSHQLETLFDDSITYRASRLAVEQLLEALVKRLPTNRRLRILEISAGLSEVPRQLGHRIDTASIDYVLAHGDAEACDHLRHEYQEDDWITVADLEATPLALKAKTRLPANYDVIICRHVLNALDDPRALLAWAQRQLAGGGVLLLAERYVDLAADLVSRSGRLVQPQVWQTELASLGFDDIEICREPAGEGSPVGAYLVLAKTSAPATVTTLPETARWLLLAGDEQAGEVACALQQAMLTFGQVVVCNQYVDSLSDPDQAAALLKRQQQELEGAVDHVVLIAGDRGQDDTRLSIDALNLVQIISAESQPPKLIFMTRGGASVDGVFEAKNCNPAHAALWGFGRVVMNEYPALACRLIDLPMAGKPGEVVELLADEFLFPDGENEVILQPSGRHALRLVKTQLMTSGREEQDSKRFRLDFRVPGQLRNLLWLEQPERDLAADEIEVRPVATGLNFRDVMYVMGLLPDEAVEHGFAGASLGLEFSGVVTRVGSRVDE